MESSGMPTLEPIHRWWLELDMEEPNDGKKGAEEDKRDKDDEEEEMEIDYYAIVENARGEQQAKKTNIFYGLFGDSSSYITLKSQQKIGLFGLYPSGWHADWTISGGTYRLYTDEEIQNYFQEVANLQRNINATTTAGNLVETIAHLVDKLAHHAPRSAEVLKCCAKIELEQGNWHRAEGFLRCVIQIDPKDENAKKQRASLLDKVNAYDAEMFTKILNLKKQYDARERAESECGRSEPESIAYNLHRKRREHEYCKAMIYHTVAIEGSQISLEEVGTLYDIHLDKNEPNYQIGSEECNQLLTRKWPRKLRDITEVLGMIDLLDFIRKREHSSMLNDFSLELLLEIHKFILRDNPGYAGKFRDCQVWLTNVPFVPPEYGAVPEEMDRFLLALRSQQLDNGIEFAAMIHYAFVHIHPFADGNGRLARILVNLILQHFGYPQIIFPLSERDFYFQCLFFAQMGDVRRFLRYVAGLVEDTLKAFIREGAYSLPERLLNKNIQQY